MAIGEIMMYWLCHAWWSYIRLELPGGVKCRELEMLREHLRSVLLCLGIGFSTEWVTTVWMSLTVVLTSHRQGKDLPSLQNILKVTDITPESIAVPPGARAFWTLAGAPSSDQMRRVNGLCRTVLVNVSYGIPERSDAAQADEVLGELDTFLANVALGLNR